MFEKRVISKVIETTGQCPFTQQTMGLEDLIEVKGTN
jgi:hypothetical protein